MKGNEQMTKLTPLFTLLLWVGCAQPAPDYYSNRRLPLGAVIQVGPDCTLEQAVQASQPPNLPVAGCAAGVAGNGNQDVVQVPGGLHTVQQRLYVSESVALVGDCNDRPVLDVGMRDRFMLVAFGSPSVEWSCVEVTNVCPNGGPCSNTVSGSIP